MIEPYKCLGCNKKIRLKPGQSRRKYCTYVCYVWKMAPAWGMSRPKGKKMALIALEHKANAEIARVGR